MNILSKLIPNLFGKLFLREKYVGEKVFTYYIPAPPSRKSGYQEKEYDFVMHYLLQSKEYELISVNTFGHSGESAGMWILCRLGCLSEEAFKKEIIIDYQEVIKSKENKIEIHPDIIHD